MAENEVEKFYSKFAKMYDPFKNIWNIISYSAEKELKTFLNNNLDNTKSILELGCGTGDNLGKILSMNTNFKSYLGLDITSNMLKIAKKRFVNHSNVEFKNQDITQLNKIDKNYDIILSTWVLSHLENPSDFVNKIQRLLTEKGKIFLIFSTKPKWYIALIARPIYKLMKARFVPRIEIAKIKNIKYKQKYLFDLITVMKIELNK